MHYAENQIPTRWGLLLIVFFSLIYFPALGISPLSRLEAMAALGSIEPVLIAGGGRGVITYPLYPMLIDFMRFGTSGSEWAVRLPSVLAILGMTLCSAVMMRRIGTERLPLIVAVMLTFLPIFSIVYGRTASGHALSAFPLVAAWFSWYCLGRGRHRWNTAWAVSLALVLAASFHIGPKAFVIFYFPLFFLHRPFKIWRRLRMPQHLIFLFLALFIFIFWFHGQMKDSFLLPLESVLSEAGKGFRGVLFFPLRAFLVLFPAPLFFWPGFCAAFRSLEKNREIASFLRTLVIPLFVAIWLIPQASVANLLVLVPPLAVLAGMHYEILIRRYHYILVRLFPFLELTTLLFGGIIASCWLLILLPVVEIPKMPFQYSLSAFFPAVAVTLTLHWIRWKKIVFPYWLRTGLIVVAVNLFFVTSWSPFNSLFYSMHRDRAAILQEQIPEDATVYKLTSLSLLKESFYLNRKVIPIESTIRLLQETSPVWVLGGFNRPLIEQFYWEPVSDLVDITVEYQPVIEWFPGGWTVLSINRRKQSAEEPEALVAVRIYKGMPRLETSDDRE